MLIGKESTAKLQADLKEVREYKNKLNKGTQFKTRDDASHFASLVKRENAINVELEVRNVIQVG